MTKEEFKKIVDHLVVLGEDADELDFWAEVYDFLEDETKTELASSLKQELEELSKIK